MTDTLIWNEIGTIYQKMGLLDESIQAYLKAFELNPDSTQTINNLALSYFQREEYGRAISLYQKSLPLLKTPEEQSATWNKIGDAYRAMKDLENAFAAYRKADDLEMQPGLHSTSSTPDQKTNKDPVQLEPTVPGSDRITAVENKTAQVDLMKLALPRGHASLHSAGSPCSLGDKNEKFASQIPDPSRGPILAKINVYEKITQANPVNHRAWDILGKLYKSLGRYQEAILAYRHAIEHSPQNENYYYYLGLLYAVEQQHQDAIQAFENVLRLNSEYILAHSAMAGIFNRLGMIAKANQHIAVALPKMNTESPYNRACFFAICGDVEQSIEFLRLALKNDDTPLEWIKTDPDLESIRKDERYQKLILEIEDSSRHTPDGDHSPSEQNATNNRLLPQLNDSLVR